MQADPVQFLRTCQRCLQACLGAVSMSQRIATTLTPSRLTTRPTCKAPPHPTASASARGDRRASGSGRGAYGEITVPTRSTRRGVACGVGPPSRELAAALESNPRAGTLLLNVSEVLQQVRPTASHSPSHTVLLLPPPRPLPRTCAPQTRPPQLPREGRSSPCVVHWW
jgi:hypothetical protein